MTNRNKITLLNASSAILLTFVNGVLGIVVTRLVIEYFGSDFNGLNSTVNQIINVLLVIEGGFTLASNVVLFAPLGAQNYGLVNNILFITRKKFHKIGCVFAMIGFIVAIIYTMLIQSDLSSLLVFSVVIMAVIPSAYNLFYATTYRVLLQTMQKEYIINFFNVITIGLGHICTIVMIMSGGSMWLVRAITMLYAIINSFLIVKYTKAKCVYLDIRDNNYNVSIPGTNEVLIQKITGIIYNAAPIVFLSISPSGGTVLASVYAVYNNIFNMLKAVLRGVVDAPRLSIGQMLAKDEKDKIWSVFKQYEYVTIVSTFIICTTAYALVLPFVSIYTIGVTDATYYDGTIAVIMVLITVFEIVHIPSGHLINMAGKFKISMHFQTLASIILIITMIILGSQWGIYGLIFAVLLVAIILAIFEIGYVHINFFRKKLIDFCGIAFPYILFGIIIAIYETRVGENITGYRDFLLYGIGLSLANTIISILIGLIFNRSLLLDIFERFLNIIKRD